MGSPNIEYEIRPIDMCGDSTDVINFDCATRARRMIESFRPSGDDVAMVLERRDLRTDERVILAIAGDPDALVAGGWEMPEPESKPEPRPAPVFKPGAFQPATATTLAFQPDDGGRAAAGFRGHAGDCVCRAIAIASGRPYAEVYAVLARETGAQRATARSRRKAASARNGISVRRKWFRDYMTALGFTWHPTMQIGAGCTTHLRPDEVPMIGRHIIAVSKHYTTVIDGVIHDTYDPSRDGQRCVYGYWTLNSQGA